MTPSGRAARSAPQQVAARYPVRLTPYLAALIAAPDDPLGRQFLPDPAELAADPALSSDPLAEERHTPFPGLIHRHPDRVLLLVGSDCPALCRFCFRKGREEAARRLAPERFDAACAYLAAHPEVREVILTGGEPLALPDAVLGRLLAGLRNLPQLGHLRIHTRLPVVDPARITPELAGLLRGEPPLFVMLHVNHPRELTPELGAACRLLADAGLPLGSQSVLLRGVNDDATVLEALFRGLLRLRVRPYYLHHPDLTRGTGHFRPSLERGLAVMRRLRALLPGLALPHYVVDLPGGKGKVAVEGEALLRLGDPALLRAADGSDVEVPNPGG